jgi:hypothetical protein
MRTHHNHQTATADGQNKAEVGAVEEEEDGKHTIWTIMRDLGTKLPEQVRDEGNDRQFFP